MSAGRLAFRPRLVPTLAAAALIALTVSLGRWQVGRGEEKQALQALLEARGREPALVVTGAAATADSLLFRHLRAAGRYRAEGQVFVDNRIHAGRAGFHVFTPLAIEGSAAFVLVNRGWVARTAAYPDPPAVPVPEGRVEVQGMAAVPPRRYLELSADTVSGPVWQNLSLEAYARRTGLAVLPVVINAVPPAPGLVAVAERPDTGIDKHREYALTWFSLAATAAVLWVALNLKRVPR